MEPSTTGVNSEQSPIFVQFLDAVYQIYYQYTSRFEYSDELLVFLADHVYSGLYGTFLHNSQQQRNSIIDGVDGGVYENTVSIWSYVLSNKMLFANAGYGQDSKKTAMWLTLPEPLWTVNVLPKMVLWDRFHCRWFASLHPNASCGSGSGSIDDWHDNWYVLISYPVVHWNVLYYYV